MGLLSLPGLGGDGERRRRAAVLYGVLLLSAGLIAFLIATAILLYEQPLPILWIYLTIFAGALLSIGLLRAGRVELGGGAFTIALWVSCTMSVYLAGGVRSPAAFAYLVVILLAGLIWGEAQAITLAGLSSLALLGAWLVGDQMAWYAPAAIRVWSVFTASAIVTAALVAVGVRGLRSALAEALASREALRTSQDEYRALALRIQDIREQERAQFAREIHDEMGQALTVLRMDLSLLGKQRAADGELIRRLQAMIDNVDGALQNARRLTQRLRPGILDDLGLEPAAEWQVGQFREFTGIACDLACDCDELGLHHDRDTALFRILQESLTNVARHSGANHVDVRLRSERAGDRERVVLEVEDNGRGVTEEHLAAAYSLGITGMRERAAALGGDLEIGRGSAGGTLVRVAVPMRPRKVASGPYEVPRSGPPDAAGASPEPRLG